MTVIWDGSVHGQNRGLLIAQADVPRPAPPLKVVQGRSGVPERLEKQLRVLQALRSGPQSMPDLVRLTGASETLVTAVLRHCRRKGDLQQALLKGGRFKRAQLYWVENDQEAS